MITWYCSGEMLIKGWTLGDSGSKAIVGGFKMTDGLLKAFGGRPRGFF